MDNDLDDLNLFLETSVGGEDGTDGFFKLRLRLEKVVRGGCSDCYELYVVIGGEADLCNG